MVTPNALGPSDYESLARIMTGPHGQALTPESPADLLVVFSCADPESVRAAARLHADKLVTRVIFSGRVGKDSGGLPLLGITESVFLASVAVADGLPADVIVLEQELATVPRTRRCRSGWQPRWVSFLLGLAWPGCRLRLGAAACMRSCATGLTPGHLQSRSWLAFLAERQIQTTRRSGKNSFGSYVG